MLSRPFGRLAAMLTAATLVVTPAPLSASPEEAEPAAHAADGAPVGAAGSWKGVLEFNSMKLLIVFHFEQKDDGSWTGTLDSPDQGATGILIQSVTVSGNAVTTLLPNLGARMEGTLSADGQTIDATFQQSGLNLPLTLERATGPVERARPQEPKPPFPYRAEDLIVRNDAGGVTLAGTLTIPEGKGPFPAAILVSGSGPQDRDETIFGHKPFLVLADHLTRRGIAVYRYDDRGVGGSTGSIAESTTEDFAGDVLAIADQLATLPHLDEARIGVIGHSEGGLIGPLAATRSERIAFVVMLAGPGLPGDEILSLQTVALLRAMGQPEEEIEAFRVKHRALVDIAKNASGDDASVRAALEAAMKELAALSSEEGADNEAAAAMMEGQTKMLMTTWFRGFLNHDPRPTLASLRVPVLALIGEKDLQVPAEQNIPELEAAFARGGNKAATVRALPDLNHLFQKSETGLVTEYAAIEETMDPATLELMTTWILETGAPPR